MHTQCHGKPLEFEGHCSRHLRLVAKKLIFLLVFLRVPSWSFVDIFLSFVPLRGLRVDIGETCGLVPSRLVHQPQQGLTLAVAPQVLAKQLNATLVFLASDDAVERHQ